MDIQIVPYSQEQAPEARAFNDRLRARNEMEFLLAESAPPPDGDTAAIVNSHFLALEGAVVRGGFLLASYPGSFGRGETATVINCREPLSEAIIDPKYSLLALRLLKHIQQQGRYLFALGMGSEQARFTRLLRSAGWTIKPIPFLFRVLRAGPFLKELRPLQTSTLRKMIASAAAASGTGKAAISVLQARAIPAAFTTHGLDLERVETWGAWADQLWEEFRPRCSFAVKRDAATLNELYRIQQDRSQVFLIRRAGQPVAQAAGEPVAQAAGQPVAWIAALNTKMHDHKYFGNMQVATILDGVATPEVMRAALVLATRALRQQGADLVVTNQSYGPWIKAFREAGFLSAKSNYILATNKALTDAIAQQPGGDERSHFTRGDSDGRCHL